MIYSIRLIYFDFEEYEMMDHSKESQKSVGSPRQNMRNSLVHGGDDEFQNMLLFMPTLLEQVAQYESRNWLEGD